MAKYYIEGYGSLEFPDDATQEEIEEFLNTPETEERLSIGAFAPTPTPEPTEDTPNQFFSGLTGSFFEGNPAMFGSAVQGLGEMLGLDGVAKWAGEVSKESLETLQEKYSPEVGDFRDIKSVSDLFSYLGYSTGSAIGSTVPPILGGALGFFGGGAVAGPPGAIAGAVTGASIPSYLLNMGDLRNGLLEELKDDIDEGKVSRAEINELAALVGAPMAALDLVGAFGITKGAAAAAKKAAKSSLIKRVALGVRKGAGIEGATEAAQETIAEITKAWKTKNPDLEERAARVANAAIAGALAGGGISAPVSALTGAPKDEAPAPPITQHEQEEASRRGVAEGLPKDVADLDRMSEEAGVEPAPVKTPAEALSTSAVANLESSLTRLDAAARESEIALEEQVASGRVKKGSEEHKVRQKDLQAEKARATEARTALKGAKVGAVRPKAFVPRGRRGSVTASFPSESLKSLFEFEPKVKKVGKLPTEKQAAALDSLNQLAADFQVTPEELVEISKKYRRQVREASANFEAGEIFDAPTPSPVEPTPAPPANIEEIEAALAVKEAELEAEQAVEPVPTPVEEEKPLPVPAREKTLVAKIKKLKRSAAGAENSLEVAVKKGKIQPDTAQFEARTKNVEARQRLLREATAELKNVRRGFPGAAQPDIVESSDEGPEKIRAAAIKFADGTIGEGLNHGAIILEGTLGGRSYNDVINDVKKTGFMTTKGRFVSRQEGADIAKQADQIKSKARIAAARGRVERGVPFAEGQIAEDIDFEPNVVESSGENLTEQEQMAFVVQVTELLTELHQRLAGKTSTFVVHPDLESLGHAWERITGDKHDPQMSLFGFFSRARKIAQVGIHPDVIGTTGHESWHSIKNVSTLTKAEKDLLLRNQSALEAAYVQVAVTQQNRNEEAARGHLARMAKRLTKNDYIEELEATAAGGIVKDIYRGQPSKILKPKLLDSPIFNALPGPLQKVFRNFINWLDQWTTLFRTQDIKDMDELFNKFARGEIAARFNPPATKLLEFWDSQEAVEMSAEADPHNPHRLKWNNKRLQKIIRARTRKFQEFMEGSKVVDRDGKPMMVFHGSSNSNITSFLVEDPETGAPFALGPHFGSVEVANDVTGTLERASPNYLQRSREGGFIYPVYLSIKNPLRMLDMGSWSLQRAVFGILETGVVEPGEVPVAAFFKAANVPYNKNAYMSVGEALQALHKTVEGKKGYNRKRAKWNNLIRGMLQKKGYDGIVYENLVEGYRRSDSWIPFKSEQIKSKHSAGFDKGERDIMKSETEKGGKELDDLRAELDKLPRDLDGWRRATEWINTPRHIANRFPEFSRAYMLMRMEAQERMSITEGAAEDTRSGQRRLRALAELPKESQLNVGKILELARRMGLQGQIQKNGQGLYELRAPDVFMTGAQFSPNETVTLSEEEGAALESVREGLGFIIDKLREGFMFDLGLDPSMSPGDIDVLLEHIKGMEQSSDQGVRTKAGELRLKYEGVQEKLVQLENFRKQDYFPMMRFGDRGLTVHRTSPDGKKELVFFDTVETQGLKRLTWKKRAISRIAELERQFPASEGFNVSRQPFKLTKDRILGKNPTLNSGEFMMTLDYIAGTLDSGNQQSYGGIRDEVVEVLKNRGFARFMKPAEMVPGYSHDVVRSFGMYTIAAANYASRMKYQSRITNALNEIDPSNQIELRKYAEKFFNYLSSPVEEFQLIRNIGFFSYLGGNISSAAIQTVSLPLFTAPFLSQFSPLGGATAKLAKNFGAVMANTKEVFSKGVKVTKGRIPLYPEELNLPSNVRDAVVTAWDAGLLKPMLTLEQAGMDPQMSRLLGSKYGHSWQTALDVSSFFFNTMEAASRMTAFITAFELASDPAVMERVNAGLKHNPLWQSMAELKGNTPSTFAELVVEESFGVFGKGNRARFMRGPGAMLFQFQQYPHMMIEFMARLATVKGGVHGKKALVYTMMALMLGAGVQGLPGAEDLKDLTEAAWRGVTKTEIDFDAELRLMLDEMTGEPVVGEMVSRGVLRSLGVDVSRRVGLGNLPAADILKVVMGARADGSDALGVPGSLFIGGTKDFMERVGKLGTARAALESYAPLFMRNPMQAYWWNTEGVVSGNDALLVHPDDLDNGELVLKAMGFTPRQVSEARAGKKAENTAMRAVQQLKDEFLDRHARAVMAITSARRSGDDSALVAARQELKDLMAERTQHNKSASQEMQIRYDSRTVAERVRKLRTPSSRGILKGTPRQARRKIKRLRSIYQTD